MGAQIRTRSEYTGLKMLIFDREPEDWRELQNMVGQLFREMGCEVEISRRLEHVRGAKEIDVNVRDTGVAAAFSLSV